jgi:hypothetical protein
MDAFSDPIQGYIWGMRTVLVVASFCPIFILTALILENKNI